MNKIGLVLGAGGARGVAHLGVLQALEENGIKVDIITGCSMGALVGGLYSIGYKVQELKDLAFSLKKKDIVDVYVKMITHKGLLKGEKIDNLLKKLFGDKVIQDCKIPFGCVATDLISGNQLFFKEGDLFTAVRASCAIPTMISPVEYNDALLVDGGIINRVPILEAQQLGAKKIIAIDVMGEIRNDRKISNIFDVALRSIDTVDYYITKNRLEQNPPDVLVRPDLGSMSQYKVEKMEFACQKGYEATIEKMQEIKALINE